MKSQALEQAKANIQTEAAESRNDSEFRSEQYKSVAAVKKALVSAIKNDGTVTKWLSTATYEDMRVLGTLVAGNKLEKERKLLNDLVRKARKAGNLPSEDNLDGVIISFKADGMTTTKKPVRKESAPVETVAVENAPVAPVETIESVETTEVIDDILAEFKTFLSAMTDEELSQASALLDAEISRRITEVATERQVA